MWKIIGAEKMLRIWGIALLIWLSVFRFAHAELQELEYVYPVSTAWTQEKTAFGIPKTPYIPYISALSLKAGFDLKTKAMPPERMFREFQSGKSQFGLLVKAPLLKDCCLFSEKPITSMPINVYYSKDLPEIRSKEDLVGKEIGLIHGYSYGKIRKFLETHEIKSSIWNAVDHEELFHRILIRDRMEYVIDYEPISEEMIAKLKPEAALNSFTLLNIDLYFVVSKSLPNAQEILDRFVEAAKHIDVKKYEAEFKARNR